jgi:hypothetical protein
LVPVLDSYGEPADAAIFRGPGYGSSYLVDNISYFVANDGVDAVFAALDAQPNVPMIRSLLNAWSNPLALLTRRFAEQLLPRLVDSAFTALLNLTESQVDSSMIIQLLIVTLFNHFFVLRSSCEC